MSSLSDVGHGVLFVGRGNPHHKRAIQWMQDWNTTGTLLGELGAGGPWPALSALTFESQDLEDTKITK